PVMFTPCDDPRATEFALYGLVSLSAKKLTVAALSASWYLYETNACSPPESVPPELYRSERNPTSGHCVPLAVTLVRVPLPPNGVPTPLAGRTPFSIAE